MKNYPIYLIHGFRGSKYSWVEFKKYFPQAIEVGLPGFGDEEKPSVNYDLDFFVQYLRTKITKKSILIGHSLGAYLSQEFSIKYPELVEKVVIIGYPFDKKLPRYKNLEYFTQEVLPNRPKVITFIEELLRPLTASLIGVLAAIFFSPYGKAARDYVLAPNWILTKVWKNTVMPSDCNRLKKLKDKVLIINGEKDIYNYSINKNLDEFGTFYIIKKMSHAFYRYEDKIVKIVKENLIIT